ncbi:MAG: serine aminopeptidase domain-containing protein [Gammaproteobacteria bacterium]
MLSAMPAGRNFRWTPFRYRLGLASFAMLLNACAAPPKQGPAPAVATPRLYADHAITADGYVLPVQSWVPSEPARAVVLAVHGFNDYRTAFARPGAFLAGRGIWTYAYDQRGFGATPLRGLWPGIEPMVSDLRLMLALLRARHPGLPIYVLGESMGAALAIVAGTGRQPLAADGLILSAPALWGRRLMNPAMRTLLWLMQHTVPRMHLSGRGLRIRATDHRAAALGLYYDPWVIKETRVDAVAGLTDLMDAAYLTAPALYLPALILYGARDEVMPKRSFDHLVTGLARAHAPHWRAAFYPGGYHMLMRDRQAPLVLRDINAWIVDRHAPLPSGREYTLKQTRLSRAAWSQR